MPTESKAHPAGAAPAKRDRGIIALRGRGVKILVAVGQAVPGCVRHAATGQGVLAAVRTAVIQFL